MEMFLVSIVSYSAMLMAEKRPMGILGRSIPRDRQSSILQASFQLPVRPSATQGRRCWMPDSLSSTARSNLAMPQTCIIAV